jgi:hypothetical protein
VTRMAIRGRSELVARLTVIRSRLVSWVPRRKAFENVAAVVALLAALAGASLLVAVGQDWLPQSWGLRAFLMVVAGSSAFYGFGCFRIWPSDDPKPGEHSRIWFLHQYWLNALGCATGWLAVFLLLRKYGSIVDAEISVSGGDVVLAIVAFLGLIGHLPFMATGIAVAIRDAAKKALEKLS